MSSVGAVNDYGVGMPLADDEVIYEVGTGVCSGCPKGTFCEVDSKLCAATLAAPGETLITGRFLSTEQNWDCSLEDAAYELATKCTDSVTPPANYGAVSLL
ncbi:hypothetical protein ANCDUO_06194 [Ancylostoma duodenale]|uniref:Uncharacterized protein n=1 Tax=Ancylostoma duodenale TaxID=51022 RepID=A0A0C2GWQ9_9BILA|nr:hypothetical protein ANCDUO_06194 [Ancylostoma duodenale]